MVAIRSIVASRYDAGTAYVAIDFHQVNIRDPYLYKTTDFGKTWTSIAGDLPDRPVNVVVQDARNQSLLFAGTDSGIYVSIDGGRRWVALKGNMPTVPVTASGSSSRRV